MVPALGVPETSLWAWEMSLETVTANCELFPGVSGTTMGRTGINTSITGIQ